jgi:hypothetical protein
MGLIKFLHILALFRVKWQYWKIGYFTDLTFEWATLYTFLGIVNGRFFFGTGPGPKGNVFHWFHKTTFKKKKKSKVNLVDNFPFTRQKENGDGLPHDRFSEIL